MAVYKAIKSGKREFGNRLSFLLPQIQEEREDAGMSKFSLFMRENKTVRENEKYAPTKSLLDGSGKPLAWEFQHISSKENENIRESSTMEVQVKGIFLSHSYLYQIRYFPIQEFLRRPSAPFWSAWDPPAHRPARRRGPRCAPSRRRTAAGRSGPCPEPPPPGAAG